MTDVLKLDDVDLDSLRQRGLVVSDEQGTEGLMIGVQYLGQLPADSSRSQWRAILECWCQEMARTLEQHGARLFPETLSTSAQTVEAFLPVKELDATLLDQQMGEVRLLLIVSHRATLTIGQ